MATPRSTGARTAAKRTASKPPAARATAKRTAQTRKSPGEQLAAIRERSRALDVAAGEDVEGVDFDRYIQDAEDYDELDDEPADSDEDEYDERLDQIPATLQFGDKPRKTRMEPLFSIRGEVFEVEVPLPANLTFKYLKLAREMGEAVATDWLFDRVLGEEGYAALADYEDMDDDDLASIALAVRKLAVGSSQAPKGGRRRPSRR